MGAFFSEPQPDTPLLKAFGGRAMFEIIALILLTHQPLQPLVEGQASYYTVASSSRVTASGERMKDDQFTCAMLEGEFGDYFLVVGENGKSVVCKLNDRGPYVKGRVIDLSEVAMRQLAGRAGLIEVKVFRLGKNPPRAPS
jgi:rare lipoprotein A